jgi:hypothetical protein
MQMTRNKSKSKQAKFAARRLLEDKETQKQLRTASVHVREAWSRASGRPASKALGDKKVYDKVREAATSLAVAGQRLRRQPEPPKHTGRKVVAATAMAGGAAYALKKKRNGNGSSRSEYNGRTPAAAAPFPVTPAPTA